MEINIQVILKRSNILSVANNFLNGYKNLKQTALSYLGVLSRCSALETFFHSKYTQSSAVYKKITCIFLSTPES